MCPVSWTWTEYNDKVSRGPPMPVSMGYSMPEHDVGPSSAVICGHGYGQRYFDRNSTELRSNLPDLSHAHARDSGRYNVLIAVVSGRLFPSRSPTTAIVASQRNFDDAPQSKSRTFRARNRHV